MHSPLQELVFRPAVSTHRRPPVKDIQLDDSQARGWLEYLERLTPDQEYAQTLAEFREKLDDALWLANWKREYVVMELELTAVPSVIEAIAHQDPDETRGLDIQEDILATLANTPGWT